MNVGILKRPVNKLKRAVSDAAQKRHFRIYERYMVQRAIGDKWDVSGKSPLFNISELAGLSNQRIN